ncbi:amidohydrolase family protein [Nocardioides sp. LHG3406-4]|uniref:amidohydrolase family protein n=1 Tax=Nocardioides sp. LHG3406-4 TaxID=2804575 RepID=UPI003CF3F376
MIIDVHSHLFPAGLMDSIEKAGGRLPQLSAAPQQSVSLDERFELMEAYGVDIGLLSVGVLQPYHADVGTAVALAHQANDTYLQTSVESNGRLRTWAVLPLPHVDAALAELDRIGDEEYCVGVTLGTSVLEHDLDDARFAPVYEALDARGSTVFIHPSMAFAGFGENDLGMQRSIGGMVEDTIAGIRLLLSGVVVRYPRINFIVPHLGGTLPFIYGRVSRHIQMAEQKWLADGLTTEDAPHTGLNRLWWDTAVRHVPALTCAVETLGPDRLLFGTDYPYTKTREEFASRLVHIRDLPINVEQHEAILGTSAATLLGI